MFRNNLKLVFRRLRKERLFTFVNTLGLTVGLTAFLLIALYVRDELSFDKFHSDVDKIYRLTQYKEGSDVRGGSVPVDFIEFVRQDLPQVESHVRINKGSLTNLISTKESSFYSGGVILSESTFFSFFDFELLDGNRDFVLSQPRSVVLTESFAKKLFGRTDVIGEELVFNKNEKFEVTGISSDPPKNSSIQFELVALADELMFENTFDKGYMRNIETFLKLPELSELKSIEGEINDGIRQKPNYFKVMGDNLYGLMPFTDQRLHSKFERDRLETNDAKYVLLFSGIGLVILLLAIINYVNLVTAQSLRRVKEIGLRKVIGAKRGQLIQFQMLESVMITVISVVLSFAIAERLMPTFNEILNKEVILDYMSLDFIAWVLIAGVLFGVLAGLYPAYLITRVGALSLISRSSGSKNGKGYFRKFLVLIQFTVSACLIIVLAIMSNQMNFLNQNKLGFDKDHLISIPLYPDGVNTAAALKSELKKIKGVESVSQTTWKFGGGTQTGRYAELPNENREVAGAFVDLVNADEDFMKTMKLKIIATSENYDPGNLLDNQVIINQSLIKAFGWTDDVIGKKVYESRGRSKEIAAIIEDFHTYSMKEEINPLVIEAYSSDRFGSESLMLKLGGIENNEVINQIALTYKSLTERPFDYYYLDDRVESYYKQEQGQFKLFQIFSSLALIISLLGLIALTIYMVEQRRKEVSIRKILGASLEALMLMLNKEYTSLVILAFLIASPIAFHSMQDWLTDFKYRIDISPLLFVGSFMAFLALSWFVTLFQSLKVSRENPADVLREE